MLEKPAFAQPLTARSGVRALPSNLQETWATGPHVGSYEVHESPRVMTIPLVVLAAFSVLLGFGGTPAWPWFQGLLSGEQATGQLGKLFEIEVLRLMLLSSCVQEAGEQGG